VIGAVQLSTFAGSDESTSDPYDYFATIPGYTAGGVVVAVKTHVKVLDFIQNGIINRNILGGSRYGQMNTYPLETGGPKITHFYADIGLFEGSIKYCYLIIQSFISSESLAYFSSIFITRDEKMIIIESLLRYCIHSALT
jgi:hypothetical protein